MDYSLTGLEALVRQQAEKIACGIRKAAERSHHEPALVAKIEAETDKLAAKLWSLSQAERG